MIKKVNIENKIIHKKSDNEFKDTINANNINIIYDYLEDMKYDLDDILDYLRELNTEESLYLIDKIGKVGKYITSISFRPGCYDSKGCYYGDTDCNNNTNYVVTNNTDQGYYPGNCVITSE